MILSSPFARKSNQPSANNSTQFSSLRRPDAAPSASNRSATLERLHFQLKRKPPPQQTHIGDSGQRLLPSPRAQPPPTPIYSPVLPPPPPPSEPRAEIYAPASIASPRELAHRDAHYAATSFATADSPSRSGRDSAFGSLLGRLGSLRRRAKWRRSLGRVRPDALERATPLPLPSDAPPLPERTALDPAEFAGGRAPDAEEIYAEGLLAIDGNARKRLLEHELSAALMAEGERRVLIGEASRSQRPYQQLVGALTNWLNDELAQQRIIVSDLQDDLHDGQVLGKLIEKLQAVRLELVEVTQNEATQRRKLQLVLETVNRTLRLQARWARISWTAEGIHRRNMVEILQLLVALATYFRAPVRLPESVQVEVIVVEKSQGQLRTRSQQLELIQGEQLARGATLQAPQLRRDAFDTLIECAPEKLIVVEEALAKFADRHLNKLNMSCRPATGESRDFKTTGAVLDAEQFSDGLLLVFLISSLEDFFVPLGSLFTSSGRRPPPVAAAESALKPDSYVNTQPIEKLHNVNLALELMLEAGVEFRGRVRAEDIANGDLRTVLRVLYALFSRYKHL